MVVILKQHPDRAKLDRLITNLKEQGLAINFSEGAHTTILGLVGDTSGVDIESLQALDIVERVQRVSEPFKAANRKFHADDTVIRLGAHAFGGGYFGVVAGPCSVESEEQILYTAHRIKAAGAQFLRGGAFKPRTSPYSFQGLRAEGIELLLKAKRETGLPVITEIMSINHLDLFEEVDMIQVGARNMQNFELLRELGRCGKPVLLKRGPSSTVEEFLMSAEYLLAGGNRQVVLCERGIRTFETATRNTLDLSAVPIIKKLSHLPVIVDPSHATGSAELVAPLAKAAVAAGADGLMIEVHPSPETAKSDGAQSLTPDAFDAMMRSVLRLCEIEGKETGGLQ